MARFEGTVALITGAASGIGRATALAFATEGASLGLSDRDGERLEETVRAVNELRARTVSACIDVSLEENVMQFVQDVDGAFGRIDVLFNSAGIDLQASVEDTNRQAWDRIIAVNLTGTFLTCKYTVPIMKRGRGGSIINVGSAAGIVPVPNRPAYNASKGAVIALTRSLALDLAPQIRANCICPGAVETPLLRSSIDATPDPEATRRGIASRHPLQRIAEPDEVARAVLFLASPEASYITGVTLPVDGGRTMH